MAEYEVWASNSLKEWTDCLLETDDRDEALEKADKLRIFSGYKFVAVDHGSRTIWTNDPDTPVELDF